MMNMNPNKKMARSLGKSKSKLSRSDQGDTSVVVASTAADTDGDTLDPLSLAAMIEKMEEKRVTSREAGLEELCNWLRIQTSPEAFADRIETLKYILTGILAKPASAAELSGAVSALGLIGVIQGAGQDVYYESIIGPIMELISVHGGRRAKKGRGKYATAVPEIQRTIAILCFVCSTNEEKARELLAFNIDILHMPQLLDSVRTATLQSIGVLVSTFTKSEIASSLWPTMAGCLLGHLEHPAVPVRVGAGRLAAMLYETGFIRVVDPDAADPAEPMPTDPIPVAGGGDAPSAAFEGVAEIYGPASAYKSLRQVSAGSETTADTGDSGFDSEGMGPVTDGATELTSEYDSDASDSDEDQDDGEDDFVGFGIVGLKKSIKSVARAKAAAAREWAWWTTIGADSIEEAARTPLAEIETELKTVAAELARDSSHQRSKKDKKWLRAEFRRIMDTLVMSQRSHEDMKLRSHVLSLDGWPKLVQADALRQLLAGGFDIQLEYNSLLHDIFEVDGGFPSHLPRLSAVEKRLFRSPNSVDAKQRTMDRELDRASKMASRG